MRTAAQAESGTGTIANALPMPIMLLGSKSEVIYANPAAEQFFDTGLPMLRKQTLSELIAAHSPLFQLVAQAAERNASAAERDIDKRLQLRIGIHTGGPSLPACWAPTKSPTMSGAMR